MVKATSFQVLYSIVNWLNLERFLTLVKIMATNQPDFLTALAKAHGKFQIKEQRSINVLLQIFKVRDLKVRIELRGPMT